MAPALQRLDVADGGRAAPHLWVHGWSPYDSLRAGEDRGREQIIPESDGGPRHRISCRRGHEDEIGPAGEGDVLDAARTLPPGHVRVDAGAGRDGERLLRNKAEGSFCGDGPDLVFGLAEAPDHPRRLVRRDAARYPDEYAGHSSSIQSRYRQQPGAGLVLAECRPRVVLVPGSIWMGANPGNQYPDILWYDAKQCPATSCYMRTALQDLLRREATLVGGERERLGLVWIDCSYPVVAAGLKEALEGRARVHVGDTAPTDAEVPYCAVFDTSGAESISEGIERFRGVNADIPILVFSLHVDLPLARAALRHGAKGFIHAGMELDQIARAVEVAHEGEIVAPRKLLEHLIANDDPTGLDALTIRQREILQLVAQGLSNAQIAKNLFLSESTVKQHLRATYKVLGVSDRKEAARLINGR